MPLAIVEANDNKHSFEIYLSLYQELVEQDGRKTYYKRKRGVLLS